MKPFINLHLAFVTNDTTQVKLAKATGMSISALHDRLTGNQPFTAWEMERIGKVLGIKPEDYHRYFFDRKSEKGKAVGA